MKTNIESQTTKVWNTYDLIRILFDYQTEMNDLSILELQIIASNSSEKTEMLLSEKSLVKQNISDLSVQLATAMKVDTDITEVSSYV